jgi:hypothetical protein
VVRPVEWGIAVRGRSGERTSGDCAVVSLLPEGALVAAIDGLGHGGEAARAARTAADVVRASPTADLVTLLQACHVGLRNTRGAAISLAFLSAVRGGVTWVGVGSVEGRVLSGDPSSRRPKGSLPLAAGIPGHNLPAVSTATLPVTRDRRDRLDLRRRARHDGLHPGHQRAHPRRARASPRRRARRRGPLPRGSIMTATFAAFRVSYASALDDHLRDPGEASLLAAYELARDAVGRQLSVLDLAVAHQEALLAALAGATDAVDAQQITRAAGDFFLEGLSTFEMVQRGFAEAQRAVVQVRRRTELSRQLSAFLADASLALDPHDALAEMLQLVAEQARELLDADCSVATVADGVRPRAAEAASYAVDDKRWAAFVRWLHLPAVYELLRYGGGSARASGENLAELPPFQRPVGETPLRGWLAASLTALDGSEMGAVQVFDKATGIFTEEDAAALVHLAQIASAAVERVQLYRG